MEIVKTVEALIAQIATLRKLLSDDHARPLTEQERAQLKSHLNMLTLELERYARQQKTS